MSSGERTWRAAVEPRPSRPRGPPPPRRRIPRAPARRSPALSLPPGPGGAGLRSREYAAASNGPAKLRAGEWITAISGVALLVSLFLPWYGADELDTSSGFESLAVLDICSR